MTYYKPVKTQMLQAPDAWLVGCSDMEKDRLLNREEVDEAVQVLNGGNTKHELEVRELKRELGIPPEVNWKDGLRAIAEAQKGRGAIIEFTSEQLLDELERRYDTIVFCSAHRPKVGAFLRRTYWHGEATSALGLIALLEAKLKHQTIMLDLFTPNFDDQGRPIPKPPEEKKP